MHKGAPGCYRRVIIHSDEKTRIIENLHSSSVAGGHFGQSATIREVSERFFWPRLSMDVRDFVRGCGPCQLTNHSNRPPPATLHPTFL